MDQLPRIARRNVNRVQAQIHALTRRLGRLPTDDELAKATGMATRQLGKARTDQHAALPLSLDEFGDAGRFPDALARDAGGAVTACIELQARVAELWHAIEALPVRHTDVVGLYYCDVLTSRHCGRVLDVTE